MNRRMLVFLALLLGTLALLGCSTRVQSSVPVARVNGVDVPQTALQQEMNHTKAYYREQYGLNLDDPSNADLLQQAQQEALTRVIDQELVRQIAAGTFPAPAAGQSPTVVTVSDAEVEERAQQYETQAGCSQADTAGSADAKATAQTCRDGFLAQNGFANYEEFLNFVRGTMRVEKLAELYGQGEQVHARHILVTTEDEARQVLARLQGGEDFATVAKEVSLDKASGQNGGDLGWFGRGQMVQPFEEAAFALEANQLSQPVKTDFGYHIIQVLEKGLRADPQAFQAWFDQIKKQAQIETLGPE